MVFRKAYAFFTFFLHGYLPKRNKFFSCHYSKIYDRVVLLRDKKVSKSPNNRAPYIYQIPLTFIPGLGGKTIDKLLNIFGTEMTILHKITDDDIEGAIGEKIAKNIINARNGNIHISEGGGGVYGKLE